MGLRQADHAPSRQLNRDPSALVLFGTVILFFSTLWYQVKEIILRDLLGKTLRFATLVLYGTNKSTRRDGATRSGTQSQENSMTADINQTTAIGRRDFLAGATPRAGQ
jgi:hypothetical protein